MDASLLQNLGLAILLEVADLEPREKEVTVDFALMQIALTNQMDFFFLLRAARVPKGPGQFALQSAYHDPHLDVNELKQQIKNRFVQAKTCRIKQITQIIRRRWSGKLSVVQNWCKAGR